MRKFLISVASGFVAVLPRWADAQEPTFCDCQDDRIRMAIAPMRLAKFTSITRCPASLDMDRMKGWPTRAVRATVVEGHLTSKQALARMLRSTSLASTPINGVVSVGN